MIQKFHKLLDFLLKSTSKTSNSFEFSDEFEIFRCESPQKTINRFV